MREKCDRLSLWNSQIVNFRNLFFTQKEYVVKKHSLALSLYLFFLPALALASETFGVCPELTTGQKIVGFITLNNVILTGAVIVGIVCFLFLFGHYVKMLIEILADVPKEVWEGLLYVLGVVCIGNGLVYHGANAIWIAFIGCLLFGGALALTGALHERDNPKTFFGILTLVWGGAAVAYGSHLIGFFSVGALMGLVGFIAFAGPGFFAVGFEDSKSLTKGTLTAFAILAIYLFVKISGIVPLYVDIFESGAKWFGAFVFYLGLLIMSSKWSSRDYPYGPMQILMFAACLAGLAIGTLWNLQVVSGVAGTFSALYLLEKPLEIEIKDKVAYAWVILILCVVVGAIGFWANGHMDVIGPYLLF
jgi:hypothetical protein